MYKSQNSAIRQNSLTEKSIYFLEYRFHNKPLPYYFSHSQSLHWPEIPLTSTNLEKLISQEICKKPLWDSWNCKHQLGPVSGFSNPTFARLFCVLEKWPLKNLVLVTDSWLEPWIYLSKNPTTWRSFICCYLFWVWDMHLIPSWRVDLLNW